MSFPVKMAAVLRFVVRCVREKEGSMVRKTKEEAQDTRHAILDAAERVFQERGVSHTSLAEIATGE